MVTWKQLLLLGLVGYVFAIQVVPADEYNASLWAMNIAATNGRPLHPYNVFSFHANESQSAGQLHYSSTNSRLMKRDTFYYDHSTSRYIFQLSFYTSDNTDLFEAAIPLSGNGALAFERATDLWLYVGYSSNNMSASNPVDFVMGPDGYAQVDKIVIDTMVYNDRYQNFQAINSHLSTYPHLGAIYYMRNVYGQGINNITIRFFIKPNTEASNPPLPTGAGVTSAGVLESFCDTLDNNCNLCSSHPRCVWCHWNVSGEIGGTCMMNTAQFTVPRCLDVGGELFNSQCQSQTPYTVPYTSTPHSTIIDDTRPITVTTGRPVTSGKPRPEILVESDEEPKLNSGQIFAIAFSIVGAVLVAALGVGSYLLYKKGRNPPKVDAVELSTKKEQI